MKKLALALCLFATPALAQSSPPPKLPDLAPVLATDASRVVNELVAMIKLAQAAEATAAYWEDACRSTPECGGK